MGAQEHEPIGTVRRDPVHGALAQCVKGGYRVTFSDNDRVMTICREGDWQDLRVAQWPITWCPDAAYHEQDNIRRAQGE